MSTTTDPAALVAENEALRRRVAELLESQCVAHVGDWRWHIASNRLEWSDEMYRIFGIDRASFSGDLAEVLARAIHPDDRAAVERANLSVSQQGKPVALEYRVLWPDGTERTVWSEAGSLTLDAEGKPAVLSGIVQDITERKRIERALRESEGRLRSIAENVADTILQTDRAGRISYVNRLMPGLSRERVLQSTVFDFVPPEQRPVVEQALAGVFERGETTHYESLGPGPEGTVRSYEISVSPTLAGDQIISAVFVARDVTERRRSEEERARLEAQLHHAQKMEAIGTLAGGVAHDFNNILGGLLGGLSLLGEDLTASGDSHQGEIHEMIALVRRGADLAKQLLGFARRGKYELRPLDLVAVADRTSTMFGRTRRDITIVRDFAPDMRPVLTDHTQLEQVLLNLFVNAGQAMPGGGRLMLRAENVTLAEAEAALHAVSPGSFARLVVADTGVGMDAATQARIFEPFFTTREPGVGSGLGLASVYGIVRNHGGAITVKSAPGQGAAFTLLLPTSSRPPAREPAPPPAPPQGRGTILVVDDEEHMLSMCSRMLTRLGYRALTASGGRAALALVREHRERLGLVILDLTMPDMNGAATFAALREIAPALKVLLSSGYSVEGQAQELLDRGCSGFIQKPFELADLAAKVQTLL